MPGSSEKPNQMSRRAPLVLALVALSAVAFVGCTQESQNQIGRAVQNWTGTNGVLDVFAGENVHIRFLGIDKLSTAYGTSETGARPYRYGYGYVDENLNYRIDKGEKKVYFEVSDYSTQYVFYENYKN